MDKSGAYLHKNVTNKYSAQKCSLHVQLQQLEAASTELESHSKLAVLQDHQRLNSPQSWQ